jgi:hypothetical protein
MKNLKAISFQGQDIILESDSMQELQSKLNELIQLQESYCNIARNDEALNDEIRELQKKIAEFKT